MKKKVVLPFAALLLSASSVSADNIQRLQLQQPVSVCSPIFTDSLNTDGVKPDLADLLMRSALPLNRNQEGSLYLSSDTLGVFHLPEQDKDSENQFLVLNTCIRADRFCKGKLKIKMPYRFEIYVNGEKKKDKKTVQDSLKHAQEISVDLRLEPEVMYQVALKVLRLQADSAEADFTMRWEPEANTDSLIQVTADPEMKGRYLLPNTVFGKRVTRVSVSPDGKYLLTQYTDWYNMQRSNTYTVLSEVKSGRTLSTFTQGAKSLSWTPTSSRLYYTATSDKGVKIITVDPKTLAEEVVADHVPEGHFVWSPDEKTLFFTDYEQIKGDNGPVHRVLSPEDRVPGTRGRSFIVRYNLQTGLRERLTSGLRTSYMQDLSADGKYLLFTVSQSTPDKWPFSASSLYRMNLQDLAVDTLVAQDAFMGGASFSPDGKSVLITGGPEAFGGIGKNCGNHPIANNYDTQAFILDIESGKIDPITKEFNPTIVSTNWSPYDKNIYFKTTDGAQETVYRYQVKSGKYERLPLEGDCVRNFSLSDKAPVAAYTTATASTSGTAYLFDLSKGKSTLIADPYAEELKKMDMGTIKDWNFKASDGTEITGYYCLPPQFDANKKYPLIVYYYGGTTPTEKTMDNPYAAQLFASRDYVVYIVNPSGTIGFGQEFSARHVNAWGQRTADDIIEGTRQFCKEHAFVDSTKIGCLGASYGGFMTQYLQTQTDLFAAAASHAGISNVTSYWGEGYWGVGYNAVAAAQSYPWANPELFTKQGSLFNADKINTPLLLLHGTADTNVPMGESIQLYNALKILGKPVEFIQVDGEDHFIADYYKRVQWHNAIMAWFAKWLQDSPEWWNDMYPEKRLR